MGGGAAGISEVLNPGRMRRRSFVWARKRALAMTDSSFDFQALVQHREYLRAIARSIVLDEHDADDVVQQSWVAALTSGPSAAAAMKWWLGRVTANFAKKSVAREREQRVREEDAARPVLQGEEDATTDFELFEQVAKALRSLPEPYRTTIHMRYFRDLAPRDIAAADGVSVETVKTRLKRGLAMLRADFDSRHGGRDAWFGALALLADPRIRPSGLAAPTATLGIPGAATIRSVRTVAIDSSCSLQGFGGSGTWQVTTSRPA